MNLARFLPAAASLCALFGLVIAAEGCGGNVVVCDGCDCDPDGCTTSTTTGTGTGTGTGTSTSTGTGTTTGTGTGTSIPTSPGKVCQIVCDCYGCSAADLKDCMASFDDVLKDAKQAGCEKEFLTAFACYEDNLECVGGELEYSECIPLIDALSECMEDAPPNVGPCQPLLDQLVKKYNSCGIEVEIDDFECTGEVLAQIECMTPCILKASCGVFNGNASSEEMDAFFACIEPCQ